MHHTPISWFSVEGLAVTSEKHALGSFSFKWELRGWERLQNWSRATAAGEICSRPKFQTSDLSILSFVVHPILILYVMLIISLELSLKFFRRFFFFLKQGDCSNSTNDYFINFYLLWDLFKCASDLIRVNKYLLNLKKNLFSIKIANWFVLVLLLTN